MRSEKAYTYGKWNIRKYNKYSKIDKDIKPHIKEIQLTIKQIYEKGTMRHTNHLKKNNNNKGKSLKTA